MTTSHVMLALRGMALRHDGLRETTQAEVTTSHKNEDKDKTIVLLTPPGQDFRRRYKRCRRRFGSGCGAGGSWQCMRGIREKHGNYSELRDHTPCIAIFPMSSRKRVRVAESSFCTTQLYRR
jgi:hypothetical protein